MTLFAAKLPHFYFFEGFPYIAAERAAIQKLRLGETSQKKSFIFYDIVLITLLTPTYCQAPGPDLTDLVLDLANLVTNLTKPSLGKQEDQQEHQQVNKHEEVYFHST